MGSALLAHSREETEYICDQCRKEFSSRAGAAASEAAHARSLSQID